MVQLEIVSAGEIVHVLGDAPKPPRVLNRLKGVAVCHELASAD
jgi:hypothetical protein